MEPTLDPLRYFTRTVDAADARFRAACAVAGVDPVVFTHPLRGPQGEALGCTVARLGPEGAARHLLVVSATHGAEGHTGSAIQCAALERLAVVPAPEGVAVTFVHLINPWGCAWDRKENEDNVDLHRGLVYPDPPFPASPEYDAIRDFLVLQALDGPLREEADVKLAACIAARGFGHVAGIAVAGTHDWPDGVRFNGNGPTWSSRTLARIVDGWMGGAKQVIALDIHTGFGPTGVGQMMTYAQPGTREHARLHRWYPRVGVVGGGQSRLAVHPCMPYHRIADRLPGADVCVAALEFGTDDAKAIDLTLIREENFIHLRGDPFSPEGRIIRARMRKRFYWEYPDWMRTVLAQGLDAFERSLAALGDPGAGEMFEGG
jgi:polar amino acid transport system ATP-binding protein